MSNSKKSSKRKKQNAARAAPTSSPRPARLVITAVIAALLIVALVAWLNPPADDGSSTQTASLPAATESAAPSARTNAVAERSSNRESNQSSPTGDIQRRPAQPSKMSLSQPLVSVAESIDAATLEQELILLAEQLPNRYSDDLKAHHVAAQIYAEFDRSQLARSSWQRCMELKPTQPGPYLGLAALLQSAGEDEASLGVLSKAEELGIESPRLVLSVAQAKENLGDVDAAQDALQAGTEQYPDSGALWNALGRLQNQSGDLVDAERSLREALRLAGQDRETLNLLVTNLARQKKREDAEHVRQQLSNMTADRKPQEKEPDGGDERFRAAFDSATIQFGCQMLLQAAAIAEHEQNWDAAERWAHRAQALQPADQQCYVTLSSIYRKQDKVAAAIAVHKRMVAEQPQNVVQYINLASLAVQSQNIALAEKTLREAIAIESQGHTAANALAQLYLARGDYGAAQTVAMDSLARNPSSADSYILLASVSNSIGDPSGANAALTRARELEPNHPAFRAVPGNASP